MVKYFNIGGNSMKVLLIIGIVLVSLEILVDVFKLVEWGKTNLLLHLFYLAVFIVGLVVL